MTCLWEDVKGRPQAQNFEAFCTMYYFICGLDHGIVSHASAQVFHDQRELCLLAGNIDEGSAPIPLDEEFVDVAEFSVVLCPISGPDGCPGSKMLYQVVGRTLGVSASRSPTLIVGTWAIRRGTLWCGIPDGIAARKLFYFLLRGVSNPHCFLTKQTSTEKTTIFDLPAKQVQMTTSSVVSRPPSI